MPKFPNLVEDLTVERRNRFYAPKFSFGEEHDGDNFWLFKFGLFVIFLILFGKLFYMTIVFGEENRELSDNNRIRLVSVEAPRGKILDRFGKVLSESKVTYDLIKGDNRREISEEELAQLQDLGLAGEGVEGERGIVSRRVTRHYLLSELAAHAIGYISRVTEEDLATREELAPDASVGRVGIESTYDDFLRGEDGKKILEVDAQGEKVSVLGEEEPVVGVDVVSSIDLELQKKVFAVFTKQVEDKDSKRGAVIVSRPATGEILALASFPSFEPSRVEDYISQEDKPLLNRTTLGSYPPGSVFKIVSALAGLESGAIDRNVEIEDVGEFTLGGARFGNWYYLQYGSKEGFLKVDRAIARSNDIFFYRTAERTGLDGIREMANKFGFGQKTGIDLPDEVFGLVPSREWKKLNQNDEWYLGDTMHLGIGQGFMLATPMQVNVMTSFMASGKIMKPHIVVKIGDLGVIASEQKGMFVSKENFEIVRDGMKQTCVRGGTGWTFFDAKYEVGCKTGTAEFGVGDPHAWFTAFAPYNSPEVVITVIIEKGGEGSSVAGPIAREILDWYFLTRE